MRREVVLLLAVGGCALLLRLGFVLTIERAFPRPNDRPFYFPDSDEYHRIAQNIRAGAGFGLDAECQARRAPGYPAFLAACYGLFGESPRAVRVVHAVFGAATVALLFFLVKEVFGRAEAVIALSVSTIYPFFVFYCGLVLSETLFMFGLVGLLLALVRLHSRPSVSVAILAGLSCGLITLLRASFLLFLPFLLPFWFVTAKARKRQVLPFALMATGCAMSLSPWVIRNYRIFDRFVPTTLIVGASLYEANNPHAPGAPAMDAPWWPTERIAGLGEYEKDQYLKKEAVQFIVDNPGRFLQLAVVKLLRTWNLIPNVEAYRTPLYCGISLLSYGPVLALAIVGLFHTRSAWPKAWLLLVPIVYYSGLHSIFVGSTRYRTPLMPFVIGFSARGVVGLVAAWKGRRGEGAQ